MLQNPKELKSSLNNPQVKYELVHVHAMKKYRKVEVELTSQMAAFYEEGKQKLVPRYGKCLNNFGAYVEK